MSFLTEYALLIAVALPAVAIVGLNLWLALNGERGTLMLPSSGNYEIPALPALVMGAAAKARAIRTVAANDEFVREAA